MVNHDLARRLQQARERRRLSQEELADKLGVHTMTVSKWERGATGLRGANLRKVAAALGVSVAELTGEQEDRAPAPAAEGGLPSQDLAEELRRLSEADMDEQQKTWRLEALAAAFRADALREAERAANVRAAAMREAESASAERARAAKAAEEGARDRARAAEGAPPPAPRQVVPTEMIVSPETTQQQAKKRRAR
jgi:transcriptional regulator with XRE-family HTH domain